MIRLFRISNSSEVGKKFNGETKFYVSIDKLINNVK